MPSDLILDNPALQTTQLRSNVGTLFIYLFIFPGSEKWICSSAAMEGRNAVNF